MVEGILIPNLITLFDANGEKVGYSCSQCKFCAYGESCILEIFEINLTIPNIGMTKEMGFHMRPDSAVENIHHATVGWSVKLREGENERQEAEDQDSGNDD